MSFGDLLFLVIFCFGDLLYLIRVYSLKEDIARAGKGWVARSCLYMKQEFCQGVADGAQQKSRAPLSMKHQQLVIIQS